MRKTLNAIYNGKVLLPEELLELKPNTHVKVTIELVKEKKAKKRSFLNTAKSLKIEGPVDWSANLEEYLYGEKKLV
ncbi:DUF104 domain-containing protein [Candidatus Desantisbacteria bacterium]|nr:DUF104 domain-containing protein [Candidatus Desantisbacteria bacterium]